MRATEPSLKYAHVERERRFVLRSPPELGERAVRRVEISDRYLHGTRLRLRVVEEASRPPVRKLGQKIRMPGTPAVAHTTMYLDEAEYGRLLVLPADTLTKSRHSVPLDGGLLLAVDVFTGRHDGLVLAEIDLGEQGTTPARMPVSPVREVTDDERFTGGRLAATDSEGVRVLVAELHDHEGGWRGGGRVSRR